MTHFSRLDSRRGRPLLLLLALQLGLVTASSGITEEKHWSYRSPSRPPVPPVRQVDWPRNPIDHFILGRLEANRLVPSVRADRFTRLRRLSLDLAGLPPGPAEIEAFQSDRRPGAWARAVARLLASPRYGERMAGPWLDAARYADTTGHAADQPRTMWLFRDWVIDAFNRNQSFDRFTIEQLAGDMLPDPTVDQLIATGFHSNSIQALGNNPRKEEFRIKGIVDRVETTGRVWLGLSVACGECHDHKYEDFSQTDYYRFFAIFNNVPHLGEKFKVRGPQIRVMSTTTRSIIDQLQQEMVGLDSPAKTTPRSHDDRRAELVGQIKRLQQSLVTAQIMRELSEPRPTFVHERGNFESPGAQVEPAIPALLSHRAGPVSPATRLTLARTLVDGTHPLVARVTVNRLWQHHFGVGLVSTSDDFGVSGEPPSHPELLDWLSTELVDSGWNIKHMQRLILTSATYQQDSRILPPSRSVDPENRLLGRFPRRRLDAEQIRDLALSASGRLVERIGGPSVFPPQPASIGQFRDKTAGTWQNSRGANRYRRSLYTFWQRMSPYPSLVLFDAPSRERCTVARPTTNTPLQALVLLNDPHFVDLARGLGARMLAAGKNVDERIRLGFLVTISRPPDAFELAAFRQAIGDSNDSDAWFRLAQVLLNLDETITRE